MLRVDDIQLAFGGLKALSGVSVHAKAGRITSVIGPNGAGKTSLFNVISGFYKPQHGRVTLDGQDISSLKPQPARLSRHVAHLPEHRALPWHERPRQHQAGRPHQAEERRPVGGLPPAARRATRRPSCSSEIQREIIGLLELDRVQHTPVEDLAYGLQKRVELARALVMKPKILLLDEPVAGMNREEKREMSRFVVDVRHNWNTTVLLIEHDMSMVMGISDHIVVLSFGKPIASGTPDEVRSNPDVIKAYLGTGDDVAPAKATAA